MTAGTATNPAIEARRKLFQTDFPPEEFKARRARVMSAIGKARALLPGAEETGDFGAFRQNNEFYYMCGVEVPGSYLLIDGITETTTLYLPARSEKLERVDGPTLACDDAEWMCEFIGVDTIRDVKELVGDLKAHGTSAPWFTPHAPLEGLMASHDTLAVAQKRIAADPLNGRPSDEMHRISRLREIIGCPEFNDLSPIIFEIRMLKSACEIELMAKAGRLTAIALNEAVRSTRPGVYEYELAAMAEAIYRANGARGQSYRPIAPSGANIWHNHYWRNDCKVQDGDWILFDCAPDLRYYTSDIGRFWPVSGKYNASQRKLYSFMTEYHKTLMRLMRPGVTTAEVHDEAAAIMKPIIDAMTFEDEAEERGVRATLTYHKHLTHGVGMTVHDHGYWQGKLQPGAVIALDPQLWIPEKRIYVRVEDTVVITDKGSRNLTADAPLELDEIERLVGQGGLLQSFGADRRL